MDLDSVFRAVDLDPVCRSCLYESFMKVHGPGFCMAVDLYGMAVDRILVLFTG